MSLCFLPSFPINPVSKCISLPACVYLSLAPTPIAYVAFFIISHSSPAPHQAVLCLPLCFLCNFSLVADWCPAMPLNRHNVGCSFPKPLPMHKQTAWLFECIFPFFFFFFFHFLVKRCSNKTVAKHWHFMYSKNDVHFLKLWINAMGSPKKVLSVFVFVCPSNFYWFHPQCQILWNTT